MLSEMLSIKCILVKTTLVLATLNFIQATDFVEDSREDDDGSVPMGHNPDTRDSTGFKFKRRIQGRIAGGSLVEEFQIPNQLYIQDYNSKQFLCGASLVNISGIHVAVTAAHCIWTGEPNENSTIILDHVEIVAGATDRANPTLHEQRRNVKSAAIFPHFDPDTYLNDIALLFIDPNFAETKSVLPANLPEISFNIPAHVEVSGWGSAVHGGNTSNVLKFAKIPAFPGPECANLYKLSLDDRHFCGKPEGGKGGCFGDFGGPVMAQNISADLVYLAGVMSRTIDFQCGNSYKPAVFVRVAPYLRWMTKKTEEFKATLPPDDDDEDGDVPIPPGK